MILIIQNNVINCVNKEKLHPNVNRPGRRDYECALCFMSSKFSTIYVCIFLYLHFLQYFKKQDKMYLLLEF